MLRNHIGRIPKFCRIPTLKMRKHLTIILLKTSFKKKIRPFCSRFIESFFTESEQPNSFFRQSTFGIILPGADLPHGL